MIQAIILFIYSFAPSGEISADSSLREQFHKNTLSVTELQSIIENYNSQENAIALAYQGVAETMMAQEKFLPTSKLSSFGRGKKKIERAIQQNPNSAEIRYIRLLVQLNAPSILGYNDEIEEDLNFFLKKVNSENLALKWKLTFINNLIKSGKISSDKKKKLQKMRASLK